MVELPKNEIAWDKRNENPEAYKQAREKRDKAIAGLVGLPSKAFKMRVNLLNMNVFLQSFNVKKPTEKEVDKIKGAVRGLLSDIAHYRQEHGTAETHPEVMSQRTVQAMAKKAEKAEAKKLREDKKLKKLEIKARAKAELQALNV